MTFQQSFAWWAFAQKAPSAEALLRAAADIGYRGVEMIDRQHWPLVRDTGLTIATIAGHGTLTQGLNRREHWPRIEPELRENLALAVEWGIPALICFSGNRDGLDDDAGAQITAEALSRIAPEAEAAGVTLVLELLNSKVNHPDYQCDHTAWGVSVIEQVNSPRVKLLYDIYHMQIMEGDLIRTLQNAAPHIGHYHTAGNPGRYDLDDQQEINYPPIMRAIAATGYTGFVGQEFAPKGDPIDALRAAFELCRV
jgi:hydroxypyruvate isomerase